MAHAYYISIAGLKLNLDSITVGNVTFLASPVGVTEPIAKKAMDSILGLSEVRRGPDFFKKRFENRCVAIAKVEEADGKKAEEMVNDELERSLNLLRFYLAGTSVNHPFYNKMFMGMEGTTFTGLTAWVIIDETNGHTSYHSAKQGAFFGYELDNATFETMKKLHFEAAEALLRKPVNQRSILENNLLTAIDLFGAAMNELVVRNAFLNFVISLESAILERLQKKKVHNLTNWISALFRLNPDKRKKLLARIQKFYEIRSDIVHEGIDNVDIDITYEIHRLTFMVITRLIPYAAAAQDKPALRKKLYSEAKSAKHKQSS